MQPQQPIAAIPPAEVEKICAGEVVERPLSVVKELVENALDAGAGRVEIELEDGGKELIRVTDDGCGIPAAELPLALRRHHTSKLRALDDLYALSTLGFRGEALGSIAAVSRLALTSRSAGEELGLRLEVAGGALLERRAVAFQPGTEVEVRELFFNTPARKKFLKSRTAEQSQIAALISAYALAYPEVRWRLVSGGRVLLSTDGDGDLAGVFAGLLGPELAQGQVALDFEFPPYAVRGLVGAPQCFSHNRARQWYFVNRRPVVNKLLYRAVDDAMREFLSAGKYATGVFLLDLPPEELDVNVHPMKSEVNFAQSQAVYSLLVTAVKRALGEEARRRQLRLNRGLAAAVRPAEELDGAEETLPPPPMAPMLEAEAPPGQLAIPVYRMGEPFVPPGHPAGPLSYPPPPLDFPQHEHSTLSTDTAPHGPELQPPLELTADSAGAAAAAGAVIAGQVAGTYVVATTPDAAYIIDQHAAHERLLFDRLYANAQRTAGAVRQRLLFPLIVSLAPSELEAARAQLDALSALGFGCALGAGGALVLEDVPAVLAGLVTPELVREVLASLDAPGGGGLLDWRVKELAALVACKAAIKARQPLSQAELGALLAALAEQPALSCPHGRPVALRLGAAELERMFLR